MNELNRSARKFVAIIPADRWFAQYRNEDGTIEKCRLIAWALRADGGIAGLDVDRTGLADDASSMANFAGYVHGED
jgi:hypothetical protein